MEAGRAATGSQHQGRVAGRYIAQHIGLTLAEVLLAFLGKQFRNAPLLPPHNFLIQIEKRHCVGRGQRPAQGSFARARHTNQI